MFYFLRSTEGFYDFRKGEKFTGAQGTAVGASDNYDYSGKKASSAAAGGATPKSPQTTVEQAPGPRQQQRKPQQKKKNKKGRF